MIIDGALQLGLEVEIADGEIREIRPHSGKSLPFVLSTAFVNSHSHLEYRGFQGRIAETEFWRWIREITRLKPQETSEHVRVSARQAAVENKKTGISWIEEHSDRPFSGEAMRRAGLGGRIFQEVITFFESGSPEQKIAEVRKNLDRNREFFSGEITLNPHAIYTVDPVTLKMFGASSDPISLHLAETPLESQFTRSGEGEIADFYRSQGFAFQPTGMSAYETAKSYGLVRKGAQLVHCCDLSDKEIEDLSKTGASVAHCPRSNAALGCPPAPIREMLDAGVPVGLGLDSPASSGAVDMFSEMRSALETSVTRKAPISPEEVWRMATSGGAKSIGKKDWDVKVGSRAPLIKINVTDARNVRDLIERGSPEAIEWL